MFLKLQFEIRGVNKVFKNKRTIFSLIALVLMTSSATFLITATIFFGKNYLKPEYEIKFDSKTVDIRNIYKFNQIRNILKSEYLKDVNENTLLEGAIAGMVDSLGDPYTVYFNSGQMKMFMEKSEGSYVGVGISVNMDKDGLLTVIEPFDDSPAKNAGICQGDKIIKVDDTDVTGIRDEYMIINMIKGQENTKVRITVFRPSEGRPLEFEMIRKRIKIVNIRSEMHEGKIGYIKIIMFDGDIAGEFENHLQRLLSDGIKGLIIDLRDNPGGSYDQVVKIADRLLPEGTIVYTEDKKGKRKTETSDKTEFNLPLAVLINGNSASASEILAGALKDYGKGMLVGTKTFGKGLVQVIMPLSDGSGLKVTVAKYFTPSGVCIQDIGIEPDVQVQVPEAYSGMPVSQMPKGDDVQLATVLEMLRAKVK